MVQTTIEYVHFPNRKSRSFYVAERFKSYLTGTLLDVGCYEAPLKRILYNVQYTGIDFAGDPDMHINLETCAALPFDSGSFSCVLAVEVLEHLDNLHLIFDEIVRVSNRYIIISLPNCWRDARRPIERGKGNFGHYGLAIEPPSDRHKWFFNFIQAKDFIEGQARRHNLSIVEMFGTEKRKATIFRWFRKIRYPGYRYVNRYVQTLWAVYEQKGPNTDHRTTA